MENQEVKFKQLIEGCETIGDLQKRIGDNPTLSKEVFSLPRVASPSVNNSNFAEDLVNDL